MFKHTLLALIGLASAGHHKTLSGVPKSTLVTPGHNVNVACASHKSCHSCTANLCDWDSQGTCSLNQGKKSKHHGKGEVATPYKISDWFAKVASNQCPDTLNVCAKPPHNGSYTQAMNNKAGVGSTIIQDTYNITKNTDFTLGWDTAVNTTASNTTALVIPQDYYCHYTFGIDNDNFAMNTSASADANVYMEIQHNSVDVKKHGKVKNTIVTSYWDPTNIASSTDKNGFLIGPYLEQFTVIVVNSKSTTLENADKFQLHFKTLTSIEFMKLTLMQQSPVVLIVILIVLILLAVLAWKFIGCLCCRPKEDDNEFKRHDS